MRNRGRKRTRFGLLRDPETHKPVVARPTGGVIVYEHQPCRRCGVSVRRGHCACQDVKAQPSSPMQNRRRRASSPSPGTIFAAYVAKARG